MIHPRNLAPAQVLAKNNARSFTCKLGAHYEYIALESNGPRLSYVSWNTVSLLIYRINGSRTLVFPSPDTGPRSSFDSAADKFGRWTIHSLGIAVKFAENVPGYYIYNCKLKPRDSNQPEEGTCADVSERPLRLEVDERREAEPVLQDYNAEIFRAAGRSSRLEVQAPTRTHETSSIPLQAAGCRDPCLQRCMAMRKEAYVGPMRNKGNYHIPKSHLRGPPTSSSSLRNAHVLVPITGNM